MPGVAVGSRVLREPHPSMHLVGGLVWLVDSKVVAILLAVITFFFFLLLP